MNKGPLFLFVLVVSFLFLLFKEKEEVVMLPLVLLF